MHNLTIDIIWHLQRSIKWHPCVLFRLLTSQHPLDFRTVAELTAWHGVKSEKLHLYPTGARAETESRTRYLTRYHFILLNMGSMEMFCWISSGHIEIISLLYRSWIGKRYKTQTLFVPNHTAPKNSLHLTNWSLYVH